MVTLGRTLVMSSAVMTLSLLSPMACTGDSLAALSEEQAITMSARISNAISLLGAARGFGSGSPLAGCARAKSRRERPPQSRQKAKKAMNQTAG